MTDLDRIRKTKLKDLPYIDVDYLTRKQVKELALILLIALVVTFICALPITYIVANADAIDTYPGEALEAITK